MYTNLESTLTKTQYNMLKKITTLTAGFLTAVTMSAQNPVVQTWFTSDPAPMVDGDRIFMYTGHDEDGADFFWMYEWRCYSSADMVNWTDHGSLMSLDTFEWADDRAWAAQTIKRNDKYYWYICAHSKLTGGMAIGVAVADSPTGPFKDAIGKPLYDNGAWDNIDPTVFIDDDGQAYIYWGNPNVYVGKLNEDMVSFNGEVKMIEQTIEGFGAPQPDKRVKDKKYKDCYTEGPWITKRNGKYMLLYAAGGVPEHIAYSVSDTPQGPWKYMGEIMPLEDTGSFTNHCGVADFKGHSYFFYHTGKLPGGGGFGRSCAVEEFKYNADGTFPVIHHTDEGVAPVGTLCPFRRVEAETMAFSRGVKTEQNQRDGVYVTEIHNGDYIKVREVDFQRSPKSITASMACGMRGGVMEVHLDSIHGEKIAEIRVRNTGGWTEWQEYTAEVQGDVSGKHDVFFVFSGEKGVKLMSFDWWMFSDSSEANNVKTSKKEWKDIDYVGDGLEGHKLDIYVPDDGKTSHKVVMLIYGSAWFSNNAKDMAFQSYGQQLLDGGFAVVCINHRASTEARFPAQINDVKAAIRYVRGNGAKYGLDTSFVGITGFSSGGHLSSLAGTTNGVRTKKFGKVTVDIEGSLGTFTGESSAVDAVVDWFGPIDMSRMERCETYKDEKSPEAVLLGGAPSAHPDLVKALNPMSYLDKKDPMFLVIHGDADPVVPYCQSEFFARTLQEKGRLADFITVPGGNHGPVTFNDTTFKRMVAFFRQQAGI